MEKRKSQSEKHYDTAETMSPEELDNPAGKRARQTWALGRISSEDTRMDACSNTNESPGEATSSQAFAIRGEDLDLLGHSLASVDLDMLESSQNNQDGTIGNNQMISNARQNEAMGESCGPRNYATNDEQNGLIGHNSDIHAHNIEGMNNKCGTRQSPNMQNMGTSDAGEICGAPPQDSGDMEHQTTGHADTDAQQDGNAYNRIHQSNNLQRDAYGNQEEGSESDCEIIGVVPNRHGEVMNHRVVPGVDRAPIVELYDRLCGLAALTNGFMINNPQTSSDGTQHEGSSYPHTSNTQNNGRSLPQNRGGYEYALFDDRNRDTYPGRSNNGQNTRQSRNVDTNAGLQNTDGDDDVIVGPMFWGPPRPPVSSREYYAKPKPVVSAYNYIESDGRMAEATNVLDDVEFLFRCPICYSTIARFKSGKVPNNNDRVIYSTKCGHMYCFECIEGVRKRRECSICRKPLKDSKQYHVVYP